MFWNTAKQAIKATGLDYTVVKVPILFKATENVQANTKGHAFVGTGDDVLISDKFATVRTDRQIALGVVGNVYQVVQNEEAFESIDAVAQQEYLLFSKAWCMDGGARIVVEGEVGNGSDIMIENDSLVRTIHLINSHDGSKKVSVRFSIYNKTNKSYLSFNLPNIKTEVELKHTTFVKDRIEEGNQILKAAFAAYTEVEAVFAEMVKKNIERDQVKVLIRKIMDPKDTQSTRSENVVQSILGFLNIKDSVNLWNIYNAVTEYTDNVKSAKKKQDEELKVHGALFGSGDNVKKRAFTEIVKVI